MTVSPRTRSLAFRDVEDVAAAIRAKGGRLSAARRLALEALFEADGPAPADAITCRLADAGHALKPSSVYRSLESLEELGAVKHVHLGHGPGLYALVGRGEREYLACERCGHVLSIEPARLERVRAEVRSAFGFEARFTHFPIAGLCRSCAAQGDTAAESSA
jgi:Fur family transcriptional regulator, ferric uptake regulator